MTYFRIDDGFYDHEKLVRLGDNVPEEDWARAIALWTMAGSWCSKQLTDGHVPRGRLGRLCPFGNPIAAAETLVDAGLWERVDSGYQFRDWDHHNYTREQVQNERERARQRKRRSRRNPTSVESQRPSRECHAVSPGVRHAESHAVTLPESRRDDPPCHTVSHAPQTNQINTHTQYTHSAREPFQNDTLEPPSHFDTDDRQLWAAVHARDELASLDRARLVEVLAGQRMASGKSAALMVQSINDACDHMTDQSPDARHRMVVSYAKSARAHRPGSGPNRPGPRGGGRRSNIQTTPDDGRVLY